VLEHVIDSTIKIDHTPLKIGGWWLVAGGWCVVTKFPVPPDSLDH
jgi:hypothetical protein